MANLNSLEFLECFSWSVVRCSKASVGWESYPIERLSLRLLCK